VLDLAGSALAFAGAHATSYAERPAAFARLLASTPRLAARLPPHFERELERAARAKLDPSGEPLLPHGDAGAQRAWLKRRIVDGVPALSAFLVWELEELTGRHAPLNALLARWTAMPSRSQRLREWVKLALHPNRAPLPVSLRRALALARRSTPRALLYAAGALAYVDLARDGSRAPTDVRPLLPLADRAAPGRPRRAPRAEVGRTAALGLFGLLLALRLSGGAPAVLRPHGEARHLPAGRARLPLAVRRLPRARSALRVLQLPRAHRRADPGSGAQARRRHRRARAVPLSLRARRRAPLAHPRPGARQADGGLVRGRAAARLGGGHARAPRRPDVRLLRSRHDADPLDVRSPPRRGHPRPVRARRLPARLRLDDGALLGLERSRAPRAHGLPRRAPV